jgi:hypothetical protein
MEIEEGIQRIRSKFFGRKACRGGTIDRRGYLVAQALRG